MQAVLGPYKKDLASELKIASGNFPGHGTIPSPPTGARTGYGLYAEDGRWIGFVELTRPYKGTNIDYTSRRAYIGVGLQPGVRGKGIAEAAARELITRHPEIKKWEWQALHENDPSLKLGKKLGFSGDKVKGKYTTMEKTAQLEFPRTTKLLISMTQKQKTPALSIKPPMTEGMKDYGN